MGVFVRYFCDECRFFATFDFGKANLPKNSRIMRTFGYDFQQHFQWEKTNKNNLNEQNRQRLCSATKSMK